MHSKPAKPGDLWVEWNRLLAAGEPDQRNHDEGPVGAKRRQSKWDRIPQHHERQADRPGDRQDEREPDREHIRQDIEDADR